ncbi:MAG: TIGR03087 family PEP-CTERM/XrtA system glycosyltransferase [Thermodesulfobacteriota bacterium]|nr:TIGR03087 family PEP-CTERM/XrtA system glycosyltransferase [Thermodesulfobacteriota bacterium]
MNILYIAHRIPYPPNKGDKIRSFNEIKHLSASHNVDLVCLADSADDLKYKSNLQKYCRRVFVQHFKISQAKLRGLVSLIKGKAISVGYFYSKKIQQVVDRWMSGTTYDAVICFSSPMAEYVLNQSTNHLINHSTKTIMDFCDVDSEKWLQYSQKSKFPLNLIYRIENKRLLEYEKKINRSFDNSIFVSQQEADLFYRLFPEAENVFVIENGVDLEYFSQLVTRNQQPVTSNQQPTLLFTGAMDYWANVDGVLWFCEKIFPIVKDRYPKVQFYIVGSSPNTEIQKLGHNNKSINITGFVEDIRPYYKEADVCVIPLRIARGIQNKVLEAMSMGKAVVTTSAAVQSIKATPGEHLLVEDNSDKFVEAVFRLLENNTLRNYLGTNARQFVKSNYNWQTNMKKFDKLIYGFEFSATNDTNEHKY